MKLTTAIKHDGKPFKIPDCSRDQLPEFFKQMGYKTGAEIGVYKGQFTEKFCEKGLKIYAIDNWLAWSYAGKTYNSQERQDVLYEKTKRRLSLYKNCTVIRKNSMDAVKDFEFNSLDFVYLDGDHSFRGIADDISEWYWRVRSGGIISGHDYICTDTNLKAIENYKTFCHVRMVVDAFTDAFEIKNLYIFGRTKELEDENKDDKYLSWMFFKP